MKINTLVMEALKEFGKSIFEEDFQKRHSEDFNCIPRFYSATFSLVENALIFRADSETLWGASPELFQEIRAEFVNVTRGLSFDEATVLGDLVIAPFEIAAVEKNFRRNGRKESIEVLLNYPEGFASLYQAIQGIRCAEFVGFYESHAGQNFQSALRISFSFWYYGRATENPRELQLIEEVADQAEWAAAFAVDRIQRKYP